MTTAGWAITSTRWRKRRGAAVTLRAQPDARVKAVADSISFNDLSYFTQALKRQFGAWPIGYPARRKIVLTLDRIVLTQFV